MQIDKPIFSGSGYGSSANLYLTGSFTGSGHVTLSDTSSFTISSSLAQTASFVATASFVLSSSVSQTSSFTISSSISQTSSFTVSSSFSQRSLNSTSASYSTTSDSSISASYATSSSLAQRAIFVDSASYATTSSHATDITGSSVSYNKLDDQFKKVVTLVNNSAALTANYEDGAVFVHTPLTSVLAVTCDFTNYKTGDTKTFIVTANGTTTWQPDPALNVTIVGGGSFNTANGTVNVLSVLCYDETTPNFIGTWLNG